MPPVDYSLSSSPQANQGFGSIANFGMPQAQAPMFDYSLGQEGAMPVAGMGGGQGLQMGGGSYGSMGNWGAGGAGGGSGFGMNMPTFALGLQGLNSLGSLYMGAKSLSLANKQFAAAQNTTFQNGRNQTLAYNDTLANRIKRIGSFNGTNKEETDAEIARRQLPAYAKG